MNARTRTGQTGTFDGISIYRLDRHGRVYQHEVTDVQLRDPVRPECRAGCCCCCCCCCIWCGACAWCTNAALGPLARPLMQPAVASACSVRGAAAPARADSPCPPEHVFTLLASRPRLSAPQPITQPLLYGLNFILNPRPALQPTPCPGSWYAEGEEGLLPEALGARAAPVPLPLPGSHE